MRCVQVARGHVVPLGRPVDGGVVLDVKLLHRQTRQTTASEPLIMSVCATDRLQPWKKRIRRQTMEKTRFHS